MDYTREDTLQKVIDLATEKTRDWSPALSGLTRLDAIEFRTRSALEDLKDRLKDDFGVPLLTHGSHPHFKGATRHER